MCDKTTGASLDTLVLEDLGGKVAFINGYVGGVGGPGVLENIGIFTTFSTFAFMATG